jgi:outer membrane biosynthesis protein TonB
MQKQAVDMRRALAEIAALMAQHPENVELRGMMVDTTAALTLLEQKLHRMPPPQSQSQPQPQPQPQSQPQPQPQPQPPPQPEPESELELEPEPEPEAEAETSGEIQSEVAHVETPVVDRTGAPADDSAYDGAESHLAALAALLEEKQAALTALLQKTDGTENGTAAQDQQLESLLKQVEALDALLGTAC